MTAARNINGYTETERAAGHYHCEDCGESPRVGVPCACPTEEITATCPNCGHTGAQFGNGFSWLAAGLNGIESGSADDVELLECGQCEHRFDPDLRLKRAQEEVQDNG